MNVNTDPKNFLHKAKLTSESVMLHSSQRLIMCDVTVIATCVNEGTFMYDVDSLLTLRGSEYAPQQNVNVKQCS